MAKEPKPWYADYFKGAELHVIKTRCRKDRYFYEIVRPNKATIKWNPAISEKIGQCPDLEDTWHSGKVDGHVFDLNLMDSSVFGSAKTAMGACFYDVVYDGANTSEWVNVPVKCFLQDRNGNRKPFPCKKPSDDFLNKFGLANPNL